MNIKEDGSSRPSVEERLIRRYMTRIERNDEVIIQRIHSTLSIDSTTKPTEAEIRDYVRGLIALKEQNARRNN